MTVPAFFFEYDLHEERLRYMRKKTTPPKPLKDIVRVTPKMWSDFKKAHSFNTELMKGIIAHPLGTCKGRDAAVIAAWAASRERSGT